MRSSARPVLESPQHTLAALSPVPVFSAPEPDAGLVKLVTELVAGETLVQLREPGPRERNGWLRVVVPAHPSSLDERGYPGWVSPEARVVPAEGWSPDLVVSRPNNAGLPLGTLLRREGSTGSLPGGEHYELTAAGAVALGEPSPEPATALARSLLELPYRWGGTDSTTGMDCSGLVYRVMQLLGLTHSGTCIHCICPNLAIKRQGLY